jgi:hypothetical protein
MAHRCAAWGGTSSWPHCLAGLLLVHLRANLLHSPHRHRRYRPRGPRCYRYRTSRPPCPSENRPTRFHLLLHRWPMLNHRLIVGQIQPGPARDHPHWVIFAQRRRNQSRQRRKQTMISLALNPTRSSTVSGNPNPAGTCRRPSFGTMPTTPAASISGFTGIYRAALCALFSRK